MSQLYQRKFLVKNPMSWLILLLAVSSCSSAQSKKKVCVIGAGKSGLASARLLLANLNNVEPILFERGTDIGGQWKYSEDTDVDKHGLPVISGLYKSLRTNAPKFIMTYPDYREFGGENRSYVKHETILEYLTNYTERFNLRQYIKLDTLVEKVSLMQNERWRVVARDLNNNKKEVHTCDFVMVCNGHFTKTYSPVIPGLDTFPGRTLHSHSYRKPKEFINKTVALLGASDSGLEIGIELSNYANKVYLSHRREKITMELPPKITQVPGVVAANGSDLILIDGSRIQADAFILCTGYDYDVAFLDESSGITVTEGKYIHPLYKHFININHPTMVFVDIPQPGFPFSVSYFQTHYLISLIKRKAKLPSREIMLKESQLPPGTPIRKAHVMHVEVLDYTDDLAEAAGIQPLSAAIKAAAVLYLEDINTNVLHFRDHEIFIDNDGGVQFIKNK